MPLHVNDDSKDLGESHPALGVFSSNSISRFISFDFANVFPFALARIISTICANVSEIEANKDDTTHNVKTGREL